MATTFSWFYLAYLSGVSPAAHASQASWSAVRSEVVLHTGRRGPQPTSMWVAAVSPTFGRLIESTDARSSGQTWLGPTNRPLPRETRESPIGMRQNCWQPHGKLLASGNAVSDRNGARQRSEDGGSTSCLGDLHGLSPAWRSRAVAGRLRLVYSSSCPHLCITMWTVALSPNVVLYGFVLKARISQGPGRCVVDR